jgi:DNA modification methylase
MEKPSYKEISIELDETSNVLNIQSIVDDINSKYLKKDIYAEISDNKVLIHLKQLDVEAFSDYMKTVGSEEPVFSQELIQRIKNIGSYGVKGKKRVFVGFNRERKVTNRKEKEKQRINNANPNIFSNENTAVPAEYLNEILCEDSEEFLKKLPDNCIDIVITSPPYNFGLSYDNHHDAKHWDTYFKKLFDIFNECIRVLKYGGRVIVNVQPLFSDYIPTHHIISNFFLQKGMLWKGEILWEKNNYNCKYTAWGSWKSPSSPYLKYTWEFIEIFCKGDLKKKGDTGKIDISAEEFKQWVVAKWSIAPERRMKEYGHPAMFPEQLVERALKLFSYKGDVVLDPFNGVGTATAVAHRLDRNYIGIDISEEYCKTAEQRLLNISKQISIFE